MWTSVLVFMTVYGVTSALALRQPSFISHFPSMRHRLAIPEDCQGAGWLCSARGPATPPHHHDELEYNLILSGRARYLVPGASYDLTPGAAVWLFPDQEHVLVDVGPDFMMRILVWRPFLVTQLVSGPGALPSQLADPGPAGCWCRQLGVAAAADLERQAVAVADLQDQPVQANAGLAWLLVRCWQSWSAGETLRAGDDAHPAVRRALFLLNGDDPPINQMTLAQACGLSPDRLGRLFHRDLGCTISAYRDRCRCDRAASLILNGCDDLTTVALNAGFGGYTQFHRAFRRRYGQAPGAWRRHQERGEDGFVTWPI